MSIQSIWHLDRALEMPDVGPFPADKASNLE